VQGSFRKGGMGWPNRRSIFELRRAHPRSGPGHMKWSTPSLSRGKTKAGTVLQLCLYADLVEGRCKNLRPAQGYVVAPHNAFARQPYRMDELRRLFSPPLFALNLVGCGLRKIKADDQSYPEALAAHCEICRWASAVMASVEATIISLLVAGATKLQIEEAEKTQSVNTVAALAAMQSPLSWETNSRGRAGSYERHSRSRARLAGRGTRGPGRSCHELLAIRGPVFGLGGACPNRLSGRICSSILEGDPFVGRGGGIEYSLRLTPTAKRMARSTYVRRLGTKSGRRKRQFLSASIDFVIGRLKIWPRPCTSIIFAPL